MLMYVIVLLVERVVHWFLLFFLIELQLELFQAAREENTIIYLQTGSGKTYISVLLILDMAAETRK